MPVAGDGGVAVLGRVRPVLPPGAAQVDDGEHEGRGDPGEGDGQARGRSGRVVLGGGAEDDVEQAGQRRRPDDRAEALRRPSAPGRRAASS